MKYVIFHPLSIILFPSFFCLLHSCMILLPELKKKWLQKKNEFSFFWRAKIYTSYDPLPCSFLIFCTLFFCCFFFYSAQSFRVDFIYNTHILLCKFCYMQRKELENLSDHWKTIFDETFIYYNLQKLLNFNKKKKIEVGNFLC